MQSSDTEHITGRRFDVSDGSNLVLFRGVDPKLGNGNSKRSNDQDMLDFIRAQEQKLKLEKLKWHENTARIVAPSKPANGKNDKPPKVPIIKAKPKATVESTSQVKVVMKPKITPKHVAELIEDRTKKASQWLRQEQREVS